MNKTEFVAKMASDHGISKKQAGEEFSRMMDTLTSAVSETPSGETINLTGYLKLTVKDTEAREGRNPSTGETIQIEASRQVRASVGSRLKEAVKA